MDSSVLRAAYGAFLEAAETVADGQAPPPGEWDATQLLAHVAVVDAGVLAVVSSVATGGQASYDNRLSLDPWTLGAVAARLGGTTELRSRVRAQGEALCLLAEQLTDDELDQLVPTRLLSKDTVLVDQPIRLRDLITGLADDHLPRHAQQLLALQVKEPVGVAS